MNLIEKIFEGILWRSRYVVLLAVVYLVSHILHYADPALAADARKVSHDETIAHVVEVMDGHPLATVMLIFGLGLYPAHASEGQGAWEGVH